MLDCRCYGATRTNTFQLQSCAHIGARRVVSPVAAGCHNLLGQSRTPSVPSSRWRGKWPPMPGLFVCQGTGWRSGARALRRCAGVLLPLGCLPGWRVSFLGPRLSRLTQPRSTSALTASGFRSAVVVNRARLRSCAGGTLGANMKAGIVNRRFVTVLESILTHTGPGGAVNGRCAVAAGASCASRSPSSLPLNSGAD